MSKLKEMYSDPSEKGRFWGPTMPSHEFITAGDSTALMPVRRPVRRTGGTSEEQNAVELRAGRGPSSYRSDRQAQEDYDGLLAEGYTREENRRQREIATDLAERVISAEPWVRDAGFAPEWLNKGSSLVSPFEGAKLLTAMPWFIGKKMGLNAYKKMAFAPQHALDAAGDPAGSAVTRYLDGGRVPSYGLWDEGIEGTGSEVIYPTTADRQAAERVIEQKARAAFERQAAKEAAEKQQIKRWAMGEGGDNVQLIPYRTPLQRREEAYLAEQKALQEQEDLYEILDAANRRKGLPASEVVHDYVRPPTRLKNMYDGDPEGAERLYKHYPLTD